jgi:hypothetical protein
MPPAAKLAISSVFSTRPLQPEFEYAQAAGASSGLGVAEPD